MSFTSNTNIFKRCSKDIFSFPVKLKIGAQKQRLFSLRPCSARRPVGACQSWASATRPGRLGRQKTVTKSTEGLHVKQSKTSGMMTVSMCVFVEKDLKRFDMHWNVKLTVTLDFDTEELHDWDQVWNSRETSSWIFLLWQDFIFHLGLSRLKIAKVQTAEAFQTLAAFAGAVAHQKGK